MGKREALPLDARLLSDAIIELNISRRNVSIYPAEHPAVRQSLAKAYGHLEKLFELRDEITIAIAKDTIIVDEYYLDRKNPVFREFALHLNRLNIACLTFTKGLSRDEIFSFHKILSEKPSELNEEIITKRLHDEGVVHIKPGFIDYSAFVAREGTERPGSDASTGKGLWERYVYGLMTGTLVRGEISGSLSSIPPERLAGIINQFNTCEFDEESYDRVITNYMRRSSERALSARDMGRLIDFINHLRPEVKRQFLRSTVRVTEKELEGVRHALAELPVDRIIEFLKTINDNAIELPETLRNLMERFAKSANISFDPVFVGDAPLVDDFFLDEGITELLKRGRFDEFVSETYQEDIERIISYEAGGEGVALPSELKGDSAEEITRAFYFEKLLEICLADSLSEEDYERLTEELLGMVDEFLDTGRFSCLIRLFLMIEENIKRDRFVEPSRRVRDHLFCNDFIGRLMESIRLHGRDKKEEVMELLDRYGEPIIPHLIEVLVEEEFKNIRRFFLTLIIHFEKKAIPYAVRWLGDERWYVKRNMLNILAECGGIEGLPHVKQYCHHENIKVRTEALKALLRSGDSYGVEVLEELLNSGNEEEVELAIRLTGIFRIEKLKPRLIEMLKRHARSSLDFYRKIPLVRAIGEFGDPRVIPLLKEIFFSKSLLFRGALDGLKLEVLKSLKNYPVTGDIRDMIEAALRSSREEIRREALELKRTLLRSRR